MSKWSQLVKAVMRLFAIALATASVAAADAGVFTGNGQDLHQITSKAVQLVGIDVTIILGRGPFLNSGARES